MSLHSDQIHKIFTSLLDKKANDSLKSIQESNNMIIIPTVDKNSSLGGDEVWQLPTQNVRRLKSS
jgi:hypothetical protein